MSPLPERPAARRPAARRPGPRRPVPGRPAARSTPAPLELDDTRVVAAGTALWLAALVVLALARVAGAGVHGWWLVMCVCGTVLGVVGLRVLARRRARARR